MSLITAKILSNATPNAWTQVFEQENLCILLSVEETPSPERDDKEVKPATGIGREIISFLEEETGKDKSFQNLVSIADQAVEKFQPHRTTIAVCSVSDSYVYFVKRGDCQIWANRGGTVYKFTGHNFSGRIAEGDSFILGTEDFFKSIPPEELSKNLLNNPNLEDIAENLMPALHKENNPKAGAVIIQPGIPTLREQAPREGQAPLVVRQSAQASLPQTGPSSPVTKPPNPLKTLLVKFAQVLPDKPFEPRQLENRDLRKTSLSVGVVLLIILLISIFFGLRQKKARDYKLSYQDRLERAEVLYNDALAQKDVNKANAQVSFRESKTIVDALIAEGIQDKDLEKLRTNLAEQEANILARALVQANLFLDLSLVRQNVQGVEMALSDGQIAVLDQGGSRVIYVAAKDKKTDVSGADKISNATSASVFDRKTYVLGDAGIVEIDSRGNSKVAVPQDSEWASVYKVLAFGSNIYLLEKGGIVWKYPAAGTASGFGTKQKWFAGSTTPPTASVDWTVDGAIYILGEGGEVGKFTRGLKDGFRLSGLSEGLSGTQNIYTDPDLESLFILDKENGRIVETEKTGAYKLEYVSEEVKNTQDFVVSQSEGKIFLLSQNKILEIPLKK